MGKKSRIKVIITAILLSVMSMLTFSKKTLAEGYSNETGNSVNEVNNYTNETNDNSYPVVEPTLIATNQYDETKNIVTVTVTSNIQMKNSKVSSTSGWVLSEDGYTYTKEYKSNTNYKTTFSFIDGTQKVLNIIVTEIKVIVPELKEVAVYDELTNTATVTVTSNFQMKGSKVTSTSGWKLSEDGYTYTKVYTANTNYNTTFTFVNGQTQILNIAVTEIKVIVPEIKEVVTYDEVTNTATVTVTSNVKMKNSKVSATSGWKLSEDGYSYSKVYTSNTNYNTIFSFADGTSKVLNIVVTEIKVIVPVLKQESVYDEVTNTLTVTITSDTKMIKSEDSDESGWKLSEDGYSYTKVYTANKTSDVTFNFVNGTEEKINIAVTEIKVIVPELKEVVAYDEVTNTATVTVTSNVQMKGSKVTSTSGWKLSEDGYSYAKVYTSNTNYNTTFTFVNGQTQSLNIVVAEIKVIVPELKEVVAYDEVTNTATVTVTSNVKMKNSKVSATSGWKLSEDGYSYSKVYTSNTNYNTTFTFADGTSKVLNIVVTEIKVIVPVLKQELAYDEVANTVTVTVTSDTKMVKSEDSDESGWKLSEDGYSYTKMYTANKTADVIFKFVNGTEEKINIAVTEIKVIVIELKEVVAYDEVTNTATVTVTSNIKMKKSKVTSTSGWKLSEDGYSYSKVYTSNTNYNTTFTFEDGTSKVLNIVVTEIQTIVPTLKQEVTYDEEMNTATVTVTSNVKMTNSKVSSASGWILSEDGYSYSKKYLLETDYETTFTFIDGTSRTLHIVVNGLLNRILTQDQEYDPITKTVTLYIRAMDTKILMPSEAGWIEVDKNLTYKKVFTANTEYDLTVSYVNGLTKTFHIRINELPEGRLQVERQYDMKMRRVIIKVKSTVKMTNSKVLDGTGWILSDDGLIYTKIFSENITYNETFTFEDGANQTTNIIVEGIAEIRLFVTKYYDDRLNQVTVVINTSPYIEMSRSKEIEDPEWSLSLSGYTKVYTKNTREIVEFKFINGDKKSVEIIVDEIK